MYSWYSDIPAFLSSDAAAFFSYVNFPQALPRDWFVVDAMVYELWKLWRGEYTLVDLEAVGLHMLLPGSLEVLSLRSELQDISNAFPPGPSWISYGFCITNAGGCVPSLTISEPFPALAFHVERFEEREGEGHMMSQ